MYDIIIRNCSLLMPDFSVKENQDILIKDSVIAQIRDTAETGEAKETIDGSGEPELTYREIPIGRRKRRIGMMEETA